MSTATATAAFDPNEHLLTAEDKATTRRLLDDEQGRKCLRTLMRYRDTGSFRKAGQTLTASIKTVSARLDFLHAMYGQPVFVYNPPGERGTEITPFGTAIAELLQQWGAFDLSRFQ
jgi:molybdenum-dependent DNA-binding transcriptional regulator ModE